MPIEWRDKLSVGEPTIDADHKMLIKMINDFEAQANIDFTRQLLSDTLKSLLEYGKAHFAREEMLQVRMGYLYHDSHRQEHRRLIRDIEAFARTYMTDASLELTPAVKMHILHFLRDWLINHIIEQDLKMKPFVMRQR